MKNLKLIMLLSFSLVAVNAQLPWEYTVRPGMWDYPVKLGTEEWKQFQSDAEMVSACQIPEEVLISLSTEDLAELCLRYPLYMDLLSPENLSDGLDRMFSNFNGIRELYQRSDAPNILTNRYREKIQWLSFLDGENPDIQKGFLIVDVSIMEVLLSRLEWQDSEDKQVPKEVLQSLVDGLEGKLPYIKYFHGLFQTNFYARAHIISKIDETFIERLPHKDNNIVLSTGFVPDEQTFNLINELSYQLIE